jgi:hypothetical protein
MTPPIVSRVRACVRVRAVEMGPAVLFPRSWVLKTFLAARSLFIAFKYLNFEPDPGSRK